MSEWKRNTEKDKGEIFLEKNTKLLQFLDVNTPDNLLLEFLTVNIQIYNKEKDIHFRRIKKTVINFNNL